MINLFFSDTAGGSGRTHQDTLGIKNEALAVIDLRLNTGDISSPFNISLRRNVYNADFELDWSVSEDLRELKKLLNSDNQLCMWYSDKDVDEYLGMLATIAQYDGKGISFYIGNCSDICDSVSALQFQAEIEHVERKQLSNEEKNDLLAEWKHIQSENAPLRIIKDGNIISLPADHIDDVIYSLIGNEEIRVTYIFEHFPWDKYPVVTTYIYYRLRQLIAEGKIDVIKEGWETSGFYGAPFKNINKSIIRKHTD